MKRKFYYAAILAAGLITVTTSCSKDDEIINSGDNTEVATGEQVIVLDMQDTDVLSTKSRPLYSTENKGAENVTDVQLFVFQVNETSDPKVASRELVNVITINDWNLAVDYDYGRKYTLKLTGDNKLKQGNTYTIVAVGQDQDTQTVAPFKIKGTKQVSDADVYFPSLVLEAFTDNTVWNPNTTAGSNFLNTEAVSNASVAEIFSGSSVPFTVSETGDGGFSATVLLKRQVAGVIGYFNRIPAYVKVDDSHHPSSNYVRLVSSNLNNQVDLTYNLDVQTDDATNGTKTESEVNGFSTTAGNKDANFGVGFKTGTGSGDVRTADAYTLYEIDLTKWFKKNDNGRLWGDDAIITEEAGDKLDIPLLGNNWSNGINSGNNNPKVQTNSVLAGQFVIPFNKQGEYGTMQLQLLDSAKNVIRVWDVKLDTKSIAEGKDTEKDYNIYRNHLYQIGQRGAGDTGEGPGTDEPQSLDKDQILTIKINDQWEFIHNMELE